MSIEWSASYEVGIEILDRQHRELVGQISVLLDALRQARGQERVEATLRFLEDYAARHFELEERLMAEHRYRGMADHLKEHADFVATFTALGARLRQGGSSSSLSLEVNNKICNWLVRHVLGTDKPMCEHLRLCGVR